MLGCCRPSSGTDGAEENDGFADTERGETAPPGSAALEATAASAAVPPVRGDEPPPEAAENTNSSCADALEAEAAGAPGVAAEQSTAGEENCFSGAVFTEADEAAGSPPIGDEVVAACVPTAAPEAGEDAADTPAEPSVAEGPELRDSAALLTGKDTFARMQGAEAEAGATAEAPDVSRVSAENPLVEGADDDATHDSGAAAVAETEEAAFDTPPEAATAAASEAASSKEAAFPATETDTAADEGDAAPPPADAAATEAPEESMHGPSVARPVILTEDGATDGGQCGTAEAPEKAAEAVYLEATPLTVGAEEMARTLGVPQAERFDAAATAESVKGSPEGPLRLREDGGLSPKAGFISEDDGQRGNLTTSS